MESPSLDFARPQDAIAHARRALDIRVGAEFFVLHGRNLDMDVDAVEKRPRNLRDVALNLRRRAVALARRIAEESARARIHRRNQHESGRKTDGKRRAGYGDAAVLQRLAQHFEHIALKLG